MLAGLQGYGKYLSPKNFLEHQGHQPALFYAIPKTIPQATPAFGHGKVVPLSCTACLSFDESLSSTPDKCNVPASECFKRRSATERALRGGEELKRASTHRIADLDQPSSA